MSVNGGSEAAFSEQGLLELCGRVRLSAVMRAFGAKFEQHGSRFTVSIGGRSLSCNDDTGSWEDPSSGRCGGVFALVKWQEPDIERAIVRLEEAAGVKPREIAQTLSDSGNGRDYLWSNGGDLLVTSSGDEVTQDLVDPDCRELERLITERGPQIFADLEICQRFHEVVHCRGNMAVWKQRFRPLLRGMDLDDGELADIAGTAVLRGTRPRFVEEIEAQEDQEPDEHLVDVGRWDRAPFRVRELLESTLRVMATREVPPEKILENCARDAWHCCAITPSYEQDLVDMLQEVAEAGGIDPDTAQAIFGRTRVEVEGEPPAEEEKPGGKADDAWPEPCELPKELAAVDSFDLELIPESLRPWVTDVSERMQCPPEYIGVSVMVVLGSLIGRKVAIRPMANDDWTVVVNLWAMIIGRPGVLKSPAMEEAIKPLKRLGQMAVSEYEIEKAEYAVKEKAQAAQSTNAKNQALKTLKGDPKADVSEFFKDDALPEPTLKRYIANDTNVASLGVLLQQNPNGLLVYRDEMTSLLAALDQEERSEERGFYLTGWNGDNSHTFDRIGRGLNNSVVGVCLSMLGSAQPGKIATYLGRATRQGLGDDGLIQRFSLMIWPNVAPEWANIDRFPDKKAREDAFAVFERLANLDWHDVRAHRDTFKGEEEGLPYLRFGIEAYHAFVAWREPFEKRLRGGTLHPAMESHLGKYRKLVPALALISHLAEGYTGPVGVAAVRRAIKWAAYLESHAHRAYGYAGLSTVRAARLILEKITAGALKSPFVSRDVWRPNWAGLGDRAEVEAGLGMLVEFDWLHAKDVATGGRLRREYTLNPRGAKSRRV
jgi:hypothetical protein